MEEEDNLIEMVHDFIESEDYYHHLSPSNPTHHNISLNSSPPFDHQPFPNHLILPEVLRSGSEGDRRISESILKVMKKKKKYNGDNENRMEGSDNLKNNNGGLRLKKKWIVMKLKMEGFDACLCQTCWPTSFGCTTGNYEYIDITTKDEKGNKLRHIIDIDFKSQFELARPTKAYKKLTDLLPKIFVGDEKKLKKIISILCSAAKQSLNDRGLHIPPWRTTTYMHSKWFSPHTRAPDGAHNSPDPPVEAHGVLPSEWAPPLLNPNKKAFGRGSALSTQFSNMSTKCC